ncbi:hypothetical protein [Risungbinella massiliensis]|uniref:hypothetical protein n=1 Tax=Risungbinella massiliensis TaxID=1329796 RepID=UPI0005CBC3AF|nr:hypothetical protein [Risungbinella massiliensis]
MFHEKDTDLQDMDEIQKMLQTFKRDEPEITAILDQFPQEIPFPESFSVPDLSEEKPSWLTRLARWATQPSIPWIESLHINPVSLSLFVLPSILGSFIMLIVLSMIHV